MKRDRAYTIFVETNRDNIRLLFQRLNYFFIATAFLIAGFATSFATARAENLTDVLYIAYALIGIGIILSIFFTIINYLNARIIYRYGKYIMILEKLDFEAVIEEKELPSIIMKKITNSLVRRGIWKLTLVFVCKKRQATLARKAQKSFASHIYVLPLGFAVFWIVILILALTIC